MEWREVVEHPSLKDLPFKIETNEWGKIMMAPASDLHGLYQGRIYGMVRAAWRRKAESSTECPVQTSKGVRVADVAWGSASIPQKARDTQA